MDLEKLVTLRVSLDPRKKFGFVRLNGKMHFIHVSSIEFTADEETAREEGEIEIVVRGTRSGTKGSRVSWASTLSFWEWEKSEAWAKQCSQCVDLPKGREPSDVRLNIVSGIGGRATLGTACALRQHCLTVLDAVTKGNPQLLKMEKRAVKLADVRSFATDSSIWGVLLSHRYRFSDGNDSKFNDFSAVGFNVDLERDPDAVLLVRDFVYQYFCLQTEFWFPTCFSVPRLEAYRKAFMYVSSILV